MTTLEAAGPLRILVVEDEDVIARVITRHLVRIGHRIVGPADSFTTATVLAAEEPFDIGFVDINLSGLRSGIDFVTWMRERNQLTPVVFITSEEHPELLASARRVNPLAFLFKPLRPSSLITSIDVVLDGFLAEGDQEATVTVTDGRVTRIVAASAVLYLQTEHVYVRVVLKDFPPLVCRDSLQSLLEAMDSELLVRTHRSYAINLAEVTGLDDQFIYLGTHRVPLSRRRRQEVRKQLAARQ